MQQKLVCTADGSHSIFLPEWNESYHSKHGAIQESEHVFIRNGLDLMPKKDITILEFGFGTGLNALMTLKNKENDQRIRYIGLEKYPISEKIWREVNYPEVLGVSLSDWESLHLADWEKPFVWKNNMTLTKVSVDFLEMDFNELPPIDLVYFDAFGPRVQPHLWTAELFGKIFDVMTIAARFTTYCCKGDVRRGLSEVGFKVEKVPGPPGKREMLIAQK